MMLEGMSLQVTLGGQSEKMRSFATTTLVSDLKDGFTGGAADAVETALKSVKKPILLSPIKGGMSVSYTHLDVYKRQRSTNGSAQWLGSRIPNSARCHSQ